MTRKCPEKCETVAAIGIKVERPHIAQVQIEDQCFSCIIAVMDSEEGLGDYAKKEYEFFTWLRYIET